MTAKMYYTLITRDPDDRRWYPQFGDYSRKVVVEEEESYKPNFRKKDRRIIKTEDAQASIDVAIKRINEEEGTPLDATELPILAAIFARSNMGLGLPLKRDVELLKANVDWRSKKYTPPTLEHCVTSLCCRFMESESHEEMFQAEANMWFRELRNDTAENVAYVHRDIAELYWRNRDTYKDNKRFPNG